MDGEVKINDLFEKDASGKELVEFSQKIARSLVDNRLTTNQIRNLFGEVRQIEALWRRDPTTALRRLVLLKPKMYYQVKRTPAVRGLQEVLDPAISEVEKAENKDQAFQRFMDLFEAILAYHKAFAR